MLRKIILLLAVLFISNFSFAVGNLCNCSSTYYIDGYSVEFYAAFETADGSCSYCSATDSYGGIFVGYHMVDEGVPNGNFFQMACGYLCA